MKRAIYFEKLIIIKNKHEKEYNDVVIIPAWLLKSIMRYDDELLSQTYNSLSDYGKGVVDTLKEQHKQLSINID